MPEMSLQRAPSDTTWRLLAFVPTTNQLLLDCVAQWHRNECHHHCVPCTGLVVCLLSPTGSAVLQLQSQAWLRGEDWLLAVPDICLRKT